MIALLAMTEHVSFWSSVMIVHIKALHPYHCLYLRLSYKRMGLGSGLGVLQQFMRHCYELLRQY